MDRDGRSLCTIESPRRLVDSCSHWLLVPLPHYLHYHTTMNDTTTITLPHHLHNHTSITHLHYHTTITITTTTTSSLPHLHYTPPLSHHHHYHYYYHIITTTPPPLPHHYHTLTLFLHSTNPTLTHALYQPPPPLASPAVQLFANWCEKAPNDAAWRGRFKVINSATNSLSDEPIMYRCRSDNQFDGLVF